MMSQEWDAATGGARAAVIGIDAAWTLTQPSGVALAVLIGDEWQLRAVAPSYQRFQALADESLVCEPKPLGRTPDVRALLQAGRKLAAAPIDIVAIDMPLSNSPIVGRRRSDDAVSRAYGGRKCSTHSPSDIRPGIISDTLRAQAEGEGYALATTRRRRFGNIGRASMPNNGEKIFSFNGTKLLVCSKPTSPVLGECCRRSSRRRVRWS